MYGRRRRQIDRRLNELCSELNAREAAQLFATSDYRSEIYSLVFEEATRGRQVGKKMIVTPFIDIPTKKGPPI